MKGIAVAKRDPKIPLDNHPIETFYPSEVVDIDSLRPSPRNYKIHDDRQVGVLGRGLADFGQFKNVVIWRGPGDTVDFIVAGHGLIEAAKVRGWKRIEVKRLPSTWSETMVMVPIL